MDKKLLKIALILIIPAVIVIGLIVFARSYTPSMRPPAVDETGQIVESVANKNQIKGGGLPPGCICHSKNPRFVSMHKLFSVEDCMKCHSKGEDLMGKKSAEMTPRLKTALEKRMREESICQECHRKGKVIVTQKKEISGRLFCPVDQKMFKKDQVTKKIGKYYCPTHDIELIDIDEIAVKSAKEPKNEYCIACHPINKKFRKEHKKVGTIAEDTSIKDCLKCHTSHSKCGGCHF